jgi:hypothetical protein
MRNKLDHLKRIAWLLPLIVLAFAGVAALKTAARDATSVSERVAGEQWEYLAVAGPSSSLTPADNLRNRKEPNVSFNREAFMLEQHLDKLGANGWELVAIAGPPTDPAYYFKRRK